MLKYEDLKKEITSTIFNNRDYIK